MRVLTASRWSDYRLGSKNCWWIQWEDGSITESHAEGCMGIKAHVEESW